MPVINGRRTTARRPQKAHIVLSRRRYERLLEDLHDLAAVAERRDEPTISFEELKKRLRKRGVL